MEKSLFIKRKEMSGQNFNAIVDIFFTLVWFNPERVSNAITGLWHNESVKCYGFSLIIPAA